MVYPHLLVGQEPLYLNAVYKTPTIISLEWTFANTPVFTDSYVAYYQSGGEDYNVTFTIDSLERDNRHELTGLPVGGVHSISLVALADLPSPVAGPVTPGKYIIHFSPHCQCIFLVFEAPVMVSVSGEGSGVAGTSYSLKCRVTMPPGVSKFSPKMQWKKPNMPFIRASITFITIRAFGATLQLPSLQSSDAGEYLCQASYSLGDHTSPPVNGSFILDVLTSKF